MALNSEKGYLKFVYRTKERIRLRCKNANEDTRIEREKIWESTTSSDYLPGLPYSIVEMQIWPRLRKLFEDVECVSSESCGRHFSHIQFVASTSRKWRHIVTNSKPWVPIRLISNDYTHGFYLDHQALVHAQLRWYMTWIPPFDAYS